MKTMLRYCLFILCLASTVSCTHIKAGDDDAVFKYREIYLPENNTDEGRELGLNLVDRDWGIWGHHLNRVLPKNPSHSVFATVGGVTNEEQFCFSSEKLYQYIVNYIEDNYDSDDHQRFAILPNDNDLACHCELCRAKGCTDNDVAPAVFSLIRRLARRFPNHTFFTSQYLTTRSLPQQPLPENTGVLISAIRYRLTVAGSVREEEFVNTLNQWSKFTNNIYVWDYINNFDDYFTPYPIFTVMQRRLTLYADHGVKGVFLNGSGQDYSCFSRIHTHVLSAMLRNPNCDWRALLLEKCREFYPVTGDALAHFMLRLEDKVAKYEGYLPLYDGVEAALKGYLDSDEFIRFHEALGQMLARTSGKEHEEMSLLYRTLMLTHLELKRINGDVSNAEPLLRQLASVSDEGARIYSESFWSVESYVADYRVMLAENHLYHKKNRLLNKTIIPLTGLDEGYTDLSILTDGLPGLPSNYHCGHIISSADPTLKLAIPYVPGMRHLRIGLTSNVQFHIAPPLRITLFSADREIHTFYPQLQAGVGQRIVVDFNIPVWVKGTLVLHLVRNKEERTMAIDEIIGY